MHTEGHLQNAEGSNIYAARNSKCEAVLLTSQTIKRKKKQMIGVGFSYCWLNLEE